MKSIMPRVMADCALFVLFAALVVGCDARPSQVDDSPADTETEDPGDAGPVDTETGDVVRECFVPDSSPLPSPTGEYCVAGADYHLVDDSRPETFTDDPNDTRELFVRVYLPADSTAGLPQLPYPTENGALNFVPSIGTHVVADTTTAAGLDEAPVLVFSPGAGVPAELYAAYAEELASHGYIVLAVAHPFFNGATRLSSGVVAPTDMTLRTVTLQAIETQSLDLGFVLTHFASVPSDAPWAAFADWNSVVSFGHSQGATAAAEEAHDDDRVRGVVLLDGDPSADCLWSGIDKPFLAQFNAGNFLDSASGIQCTGVDDPTEGWHLGVLGGDSCNFYVELNRNAVSGSRAARFSSSNHMAFSDFSYVAGGTAIDRETTESSRAMLLAFADVVLGGAPDDGYAAFCVDHPEVDVYEPLPVAPDPVLDTDPPRTCLESESPLPPFTGEYCAVGHDYHLVDEARVEVLTPLDDADRRELFVRAFLPADGMSSGQILPYRGENGALNGIPDVETHAARGWTPALELSGAPVAIFSTELGASLEAYSSYAEELASHGFAVLLVGHTGFSGDVWITSGATIGPMYDALAKSNESIETMRADLSFVLSHFEALPTDAPWTAFADFGRVVAVGHGQGAAAAAELAHDDGRVIAVAMLDGDPAADALDEGLEAPFLSMFNALNFNDEATGPLCTGLDDPTDGCNAFLELIDHARPGSVLARFPSAAHEAFSDEPYTLGGDSDALLTSEASRSLLLTFAMIRLGDAADDYSAFLGAYPSVDLHDAVSSKW